MYPLLRPADAVINFLERSTIVLLVLLFVVYPASAQVSHNGVTCANQGSTLNFAQIVNCGSGTTCAWSSPGVCTITASGGGGGTVTSVGLTMPSIFSVTGSPVTTSGTLAVTLTTELANRVFAGPTTGAAATPTFRALVSADLPAGTGTVTSVGLTVPAEFAVTGSPVTTAGTLAVSKATQTANTVWAGPTSGGAAQPAFRALVAADMP